MDYLGTCMYRSKGYGTLYMYLSHFGLKYALVVLEDTLLSSQELSCLLRILTN